ncbi:hypothetical protein CLAFUW4_02725 [Fulvia fulva]|uniref:Uncharacterized protein n=1 Tax=Passalora fulva TaxID=5499 RepID=A0A9Q8L9R6_PASFU|nr:uncharacterized protein CLAFUR5_02713 [Fulvia fulva]KAK4630907.1 hypothetical protein CLAFUR4_02720 [Fulvia fulva]KAK4633020.1 hypothetical protein CLAFUR0_02722 [Fulvia fulva]UJO13314.1 hypothetical protein CLAFUR5_02713 [Fulvia fulva]WPV10468.1 hypothetical protein CLAFUW4_02725 [Fulvia fulva]WPV25968.1 hypothetical protein CLAFUW7_02724 [Fulvia fulva]
MSGTDEISQRSSPAGSAFDDGPKEQTPSPAELLIERIWNILAATLRSTPQSLAGRMKGIPGQRGFVDSMREQAGRWPECYTFQISYSQRLPLLRPDVNDLILGT